MNTDVKRDEAKKALSCLYIAIDEHVANDVNTKVGAYIKDLEQQILDYRAGLTRMAGHRLMQVAQPARELLNKLKI